MANIESKNINTYPTAYRGIETVSRAVYDPESRIPTEENISRPYVALADYRNGSFVINMEKNGRYRNIEFMLHGYYFKIKKLEVDETNPKIIYAHIKLEIKGDAENLNNTNYKALSLIDLGNSQVENQQASQLTNATTLDENDIFTGLEILSRDPSDPEPEDGIDPVQVKIYHYYLDLLDEYGDVPAKSWYREKINISSSNEQVVPLRDVLQWDIDGGVYLRAPENFSGDKVVKVVADRTNIGRDLVVYHNIECTENIYSTEGDIYTEVGDIYATTGDIHSETGDVYSESGDIYTKAGDIIITNTNQGALHFKSTAWGDNRRNFDITTKSYTDQSTLGDFQLNFCAPTADLSDPLYPTLTLTERDLILGFDYTPADSTRKKTVTKIYGDVQLGNASKTLGKLDIYGKTTLRGDTDINGNLNLYSAIHFPKDFNDNISFNAWEFTKDEFAGYKMIDSSHLVKTISLSPATGAFAASSATLGSLEATSGTFETAYVEGTINFGERESGDTDWPASVGWDASLNTFSLKLTQKYNLNIASSGLTIDSYSEQSSEWSNLVSISTSNIQVKPEVELTNNTEASVNVSDSTISAAIKTAGGAYVGKNIIIGGASSTNSLWLRNGCLKADGGIECLTKLSLPTNTAFTRHHIEFGTEGGVIRDGSLNEFGNENVQEGSISIKAASNKIVYIYPALAVKGIAQVSGALSANTVGATTSITSKSLSCFGADAPTTSSSSAAISASAGGIYAAGNIRSNAQIIAQSFNALSDIRLKEHIKPYHSAKSILELPIVEFDFKDTGKHSIGCLAQDLQEICPEIVSGEDILSIEENKIVYLLLDEVKKLKAEVEELKDKLN